MKIIHSKKIFIQVKNELSPRATLDKCVDQHIQLKHILGLVKQYCFLYHFSDGEAPVSSVVTLPPRRSGTPHEGQKMHTFQPSL